MVYLPIEQYGIIGDMHTVALVGLNGSIDWWCYPHFDSPSVFGAMLDDVKGGRFQIAPARDGVQYKQFYFPDTNVLITRFLTPDGVGEVTDFMPIDARLNGHSTHLLIRRVTVVRGSMPFHLLCQPAFDYARATHQLDLTPEGAIFRAPNFALGLASQLPMQQQGPGVHAKFVLQEGENTTFILSEVDGNEGC